MTEDDELEPIFDMPIREFYEVCKGIPEGMVKCGTCQDEGRIVVWADYAELSHHYVIEHVFGGPPKSRWVRWFVAVGHQHRPGLLHPDGRQYRYWNGYIGVAVMDDGSQVCPDIDGMVPVRVPVQSEGEAAS